MPQALDDPKPAPLWLRGLLAIGLLAVVVCDLLRVAPVYMHMLLIGSFTLALWNLVAGMKQINPRIMAIFSVTGATTALVIQTGVHPDWPLPRLLESVTISAFSSVTAYLMLSLLQRKTPQS